MSIFFTSDQHFYHENIIRYCKRPFKDAPHMNEEMVRIFNELVGPGDVVYHLGDFSMALRPVELYLPRMNGEHHLIAGNHDHVHPVHHKNRVDKVERATKVYQDSGFKSIALEGSIEIAGQTVKLHHMPYSGDSGEGERYTQWRPKNEGGWLLHGHVHDNWKLKGKQINVGVDVWDFKPVPIKAIEAIILAGPTHCINCGVETERGAGSARCKECWDSRCG